MKKRISVSLVMFFAMFVYLGSHKTGPAYDGTPLFQMVWGLDKVIIGYGMVLISSIFGLIAWVPYFISRRRQPWT